MKLDLYLTQLTKINPNLIKDLNVRPEATKFPEEIIGIKLLDVGLGDEFFNLTPKTREQKQKTS